MAMSRRIGSSLPLLRQLVNGESVAPLPSLAISEKTRNFASQAKQPNVKTKLPMALYGGSGNYASALFLAAAKANSLEKVESEIMDIVQASKKSPKFSQFIRDLSVPRKTRVKAVNDVFGEAKFTDVTKNFLSVLADNGRLKNIERIATRFVDLTMAHRGEVKVTVTSVIPLPAEEEKELKQTLQDLLGKGKIVKLEQKVDPSILGGLVVEFSQKVLDMSIKTRAKQMENFLREPLHF